MSKKPANSTKTNTKPNISKSSAAKKPSVAPPKKPSENIESSTLPVKLNEIPDKLINTLEELQEALAELLEKQSHGVSPEFSALMDGYVNKANESEAVKVRFAHIENMNNELKEEARNLKELNRQLHSDLEAAREASRLAESDLHKSKRDFDMFKQQYEDKLNSLTEEKNKLLIRSKELSDIRESNLKEINSLKAEMLEIKHLLKQSEQERMVQEESHKRAIRENAMFIQELKEKVDLRTREVEYKDALLNQLIKQASIEESDLDPNDAFTNPSPPPLVSPPSAPKPKLVKPIDASKTEATFDDGWSKPDEKPSLEAKSSFSDSPSFSEPSSASQWGAFNK